MQAFPEFKTMPSEFWALVKFVSETLHYTDRKTKSIKTYTLEEITELLTSRNIAANNYTIRTAKRYFDKRATVLNEFVQHMLMDAQTAKSEYEKLLPLYERNGFICKLPINKQGGEMKKVNYFTAIINILTEKTIRNSSIYDGSLGFDDDPRGLIYVLDKKNNLIGASSRRYDGAYPEIMNPEMVWEIKEYYYATTFGSRVADGVYETQLDGYEFRDLKNRFGKEILHVFFIDAYKTWWIDGKSYLCRIIDILNSGLVDEVIVGKEVFTRWPELISSVIEK